MRLSALTILLSLALNGMAAAGCGAKSQGSVPPGGGAAAAAPTQAGREAKAGMEREVRILAQGNYPTADGFVVVARDPETYSALRAMAGEMPELDAAFFKDSAVVGAFLGQRRTSGYAAEVTVAPDGVNVAESAPSPETPVKMVLSAPFRIVSVPLDRGRPLKIVFDRTWRAAGRAYRLSAGEVTLTRGRAGAPEKFKLRGDVRVMREGRLVTFIFELKGSGDANAPAYQSVATGISQADGRTLITHLDLGPLSGRQATPLRALVEFNEAHGNFSLSSPPSQTSDGLTIEVRMEAHAGPPA